MSDIPPELGPPKTILTTIYEIAPTVLDDLGLWLDQRAGRIPTSQLFGTLASSAFPTYTDYTSSLLWTSTGTAPAGGNASLSAKYVQFGKFVHYYGYITFGSTTTFGTGNYRFSLPVAAVTAANVPGTGFIVDASAGAIGQVIPVYVTSTSVAFLYGATYLGTATSVGQTTPWTWAQSDEVHWNMVYEAA